MTPDEIVTKVGDQLGIRRVFGEPVERDGLTVIPVAGYGPAGTRCLRPVSRASV